MQSNWCFSNEKYAPQKIMIRQDIESVSKRMKNDDSLYQALSTPTHECVKWILGIWWIENIVEMWRYMYLDFR